jgi:hypothetical protein
MKLVVENSEDDLRKRAAAEEFDSALEAASINLLRVIAGAGNPERVDLRRGERRGARRTAAQGQARGRRLDDYPSRRRDKRERRIEPTLGSSQAVACGRVRRK